MCLYDIFVDDEGSIYTTVFEFLFSVIIGIFGIKTNYRYIQELKEEKKRKPLGRKGNVIEPIMRWFSWFQIVYWPYNLLYFWINVNGIIPSRAMNGWWCIVAANSLDTGRKIIMFNSLFVAAIRYVYVIHDRKANQWEFENVGKWMAISSFAVPIALKTIIELTNDFTEFPFSVITRFNNCTDSYYQASNINFEHSIKPIAVEWTLHYLPENFVRSIYYFGLTILTLVAYNVIEGFLYLQINRHVKR